MTSFTAKAAFGLGITSSIDFVNLMNRYKLVQEKGVAFINATATKYPAKAHLVVFESVRELFRCYKNIKPHQVIVVSDVPSILKEVSDFLPLDFDNARSFEFNFKEVDPQIVLRAMKSKTATITSKFTGYNNLGYHINRVSNTGDFIAAFMALNGNLEFDRRDMVRKALKDYFLSEGKPQDIAVVLKAVTNAVKGRDISEQVERFNVCFEKQAMNYHEAIHSKQPSAIAAKKYDVDAYAIGYMKKLIKGFQVTEDRMKRNGHRTETA